MHQKAFYDVSEPPADVKRVPELYLQPVLRKGAGRPPCSHSHPIFGLSDQVSHRLSAFYSVTSQAALQASAADSIF